MKNLVMRVKSLEQRQISVSCPFFTSTKSIDKFVVSNLPSLLKRTKKHQEKGKEAEGYTHFLGEEAFIGLEKEEAKKIIASKAKGIFESRVAYYAPLMGIPDGYYKIRVRDMKTRLGVNSKKTKTLTFQLGLLQYSLPIIDSVVVHELAHHFRYDHSPAFYKIVLEYCPDYWEKRKKILSKIYE